MERFTKPMRQVHLVTFSIIKMLLRCMVKKISINIPFIDVSSLIECITFPLVNPSMVYGYGTATYNSLRFQFKNFNLKSTGFAIRHPLHQY